jgi:hypothetical protein
MCAVEDGEARAVR